MAFDPTRFTEEERKHVENVYAGLEAPDASKLSDKAKYELAGRTDEYEGSAIKDIGLSAVRGLGQIGHVAAGAGELLGLGGAPIREATKKYEDLITSGMSQRSRDEASQFGKIDGFADTASWLAQHPRAVLGMAAESAPSMLIGGGLGGLTAKALGRAGVAGAAEMGTLGRVSIGQGELTAGTTASQVAEQNPDAGYGQIAAPAIAAGLSTGLTTKMFGGLQGKSDIDSLIGGLASGGGAKAAATQLGSNPSGFLGKMARGAIGEAVEEAVQSGPEQAMLNVGTNRPIEEGVAKQMTVGGVVGGLTGGVGGSVHAMQSRAEEAKAMRDAIAKSENEQKAFTEAERKAAYDAAGQSMATPEFQANFDKLTPEQVASLKTSNPEAFKAASEARLEAIGFNVPFEMVKSGDVEVKSYDREAVAKFAEDNIRTITTPDIEAIKAATGINVEKAVTSIHGALDYIEKSGVDIETVKTKKAIGELTKSINTSRRDAGESKSLMLKSDTVRRALDIIRNEKAAEAAKVEAAKKLAEEQRQASGVENIDAMLAQQPQEAVQPAAVNQDATSPAIESVSREQAPPAPWTPAPEVIREIDFERTKNASEVYGKPTQEVATPKHELAIADESSDAIPFSRESVGADVSIDNATASMPEVDFYGEELSGEEIDHLNREATLNRWRQAEASDAAMAAKDGAKYVSQNDANGLNVADRYEDLDESNVPMSGRNRASSGRLSTPAQPPQSRSTSSFVNDGGLGLARLINQGSVKVVSSAEMSKVSGVDGAQGFFKDGKIYLNKDAITQGNVKAVLFHEFAHMIQLSELGGVRGKALMGKLRNDFEKAKAAGENASELDRRALARMEADHNTRGDAEYQFQEFAAYKIEEMLTARAGFKQIIGSGLGMMFSRTKAAISETFGIEQSIVSNSDVLLAMESAIDYHLINETGSASAATQARASMATPEMLGRAVEIDMNHPELVLATLQAQQDSANGVLDASGFLEASDLAAKMESKDEEAEIYKAIENVGRDRMSNQPQPVRNNSGGRLSIASSIGDQYDASLQFGKTFFRELTGEKQRYDENGKRIASNSMQRIGFLQKLMPTINLVNRYPQLRPIWDNMQLMLGQTNRMASTVHEIAPRLMPASFRGNLVETLDAIGRGLLGTGAASDAYSSAIDTLSNAIGAPRMSTADRQALTKLVNHMDPDAKNRRFNTYHEATQAVKELSPEAFDVYQNEYLKLIDHLQNTKAIGMIIKIAEASIGEKSDYSNFMRNGDIDGLVSRVKSDLDAKIDDIDTTTKEGRADAKGVERVGRMIDDILEMRDESVNRAYLPLTRSGSYGFYKKAGSDTMGITGYERVQFNSAAEAQKAFDGLQESERLSGEELEAVGLDPESAGVLRLADRDIMPQFITMGAIEDILRETSGNNLKDENGKPLVNALAAKVFKEQAMRMIIEKESARMQREMHRKGVGGFDTDLQKVLSKWSMNTAQTAAKDVYYERITRSAKKLNENSDGDLRQYVNEVIQFMENPSEPALIPRAMLTTYMLSSAASAMMNVTSGATNTIPFLNQFGGLGNISKIVGDATVRGMKYAASGRVNPEYEKYMAGPRDSGRLEPGETQFMMSMASGQGNVRKMLSHGSKAMMSMFATTETGNRMATAIASGKVFEESMSTEEGRAKMEDYFRKNNLNMSEGNAPDLATFQNHAIDATQMVLNKSNTPPWARSGAGSLAFTFKNYSLGVISLYNALPMKQKIVMLAMFTVLSGLGGLPFEDDLLDLVETLAAAGGHPISAKEEAEDFIRHSFELALGKGSSAAKTATGLTMRGISEFLPIDISQRTGMQNIIPGTQLLNMSKPTAVTDSLKEIAGPAAGLAQKFYQGANKLVQGDWGGVINFMPSFMASPMIGLMAAADGHFVDSKGKPVAPASMLDGFIKAMGFQTDEMGEIGRLRREIQGRKDRAAFVKAIAVNDIVKFSQEGDSAGRAKVLERLRDWNDSNPDAKVKPAEVNKAAFKLARESREDPIKRMSKVARKEDRVELMRRYHEILNKESK